MIKPAIHRIWAWWGPFLLRVAIALDAFIQAWFRGGVLGVTISSRCGTAADHGHWWGIAGDWLLNHCWPFGPDKCTGESHCTGAIKNDSLRAVYALGELLGDPKVVDKRNLHEFKKVVLDMVKQILEEGK